MRTVIIAILSMTLFLDGIRAQQQLPPFKLRVMEAVAIGLDTITSIREPLDIYRNTLTKKKSLESYYHSDQIRMLYDDAIRNGNATVHKLKQIVMTLPQRMLMTDIRKVALRMDSIYSQILSGQLFDDFVERYSECHDTIEIRRLQSVPEFENVVFGLNIGEVSSPFYTPSGLHVVKLISRDTLTFEQYKEEFEARRGNSTRMDALMNNHLESLKKDMSFSQNNTMVDAFIKGRNVSGPLFSVSGKDYSIDDLYKYQSSRSVDKKMMYQEFVSKVLMSEYNSRMKSALKIIDDMVSARKDSLMAAEVTRLEVDEKLQNDTNSLAEYFNIHRKMYNWEVPKYRGVVIHATNKKICKKAEKLIKKAMKDADLSSLDASEVIRPLGIRPGVVLEEGLFSIGDNEYVDSEVYGARRTTPKDGFPFISVVGHKVQGPESWKEIKARLFADYKKIYELQWIELLRKKFRQ